MQTAANPHPIQKITVVLADDHTIVRQGLRSLLESELDIEVVGEAENGRQAVELALKHHPAIVVMDIGMPEMYGMQATRIIKQKNPHTKVIVLSMYSDEEVVSQMIRLGASAYLIKQAAAAELLKAIREVRIGNAYFSPSISRLIVNKLNAAEKDDGKPHSLHALTSREIEVLQLISEGRSNKSISLQLGISCKTVEKHRASVMQKLNTHDVAGLTRYAFAHGIIH